MQAQASSVVSRNHVKSHISMRRLACLSLRKDFTFYSALSVSRIFYFLFLKNIRYFDIQASTLDHKQKYLKAHIIETHQRMCTVLLIIS